MILHVLRWFCPKTGCITGFNTGLFLVVALFAIGSCTLPGPAFAQSAVDLNNAARQSEDIQRQQFLRQGDDVQRSLNSNRAPAKIIAPLPAVPTKKGGGCRQIQTISISGAPLLKTKDRSRIVDTYAHQCLGVTEIQKIMADITTYYIKKGYATTRAYLPKQDLSTGLLVINVVEGKLGSITLDGKKNSVFIPGAFPRLEGKVLNLRDIEQGLDQVNRLSSNNATMDILPGAEAGQSDIVIKNDPSKRWHINATADNYGTRTTGREQIGLTGSLDNLFGLNDFISYTKRRSTPFGDRAKQSSSDSVLLSVPYGYTTFLGGYSGSDYDSTLSTPGGLDLHLNGDNRAVFGTVDQVLYRGQDDKLNVSATLTEKEARNFFAGQRLTVSSRTLTVLDLATTYSTLCYGGSASFSGGYSRGLKLFGALHDSDGLPNAAGHAQFDKFTVSASYARPFAYQDQNFLYSTQVSGQYALDTLFGSEQFSVGGIYSVRGFYDESLANDHGILMRNDLTWLKTLPPIRGHVVVFRPYVALDGGTTSGRADFSPNGTLVGAAVGFTLATGPASFDVYTGHPVVKTDEMDDEGFNTFARFSITF